MMGSMRTCVADRQTDRQTDGAGYIGPRKGGSNKGFMVQNLTNEAFGKEQIRLTCLVGDEQICIIIFSVRLIDPLSVQCLVPLSDN